MEKENEIEILLVDDNIHDAELAINALRRNNIANHLIHLEDGVAATDFLFGVGRYAGRDTGNKPRVILLDLKMPRLNGIEVLKRIKANDLTKEIPVVVLTSSKEGPDIEQCYALGVNSYIVKPVEFENFSRAVAELGMYWMLLNQAPKR